MGNYELKVQSVEHATHDVLRIRTEKPEHFQFNPGQACEVAINKEGWRLEFRPFTFTCLPDDAYLEFFIKTYPQHKGVTNELLHLKTNDQLIVTEAWGTISYKGPGVFIAGGAGVTPFISIFRHLHHNDQKANSKLICANKTSVDIINHEEFNQILGKNFINILSDEKSDTFANGFITKDFLERTVGNLNQYFYICGPDPMMDAVTEQLHQMGVKDQLIVKEEF